MTELELKDRFKKFSVRIIKMVDSMPDTISGRAIGAQVVRSGTSPAANYRAACLGKSEKDFLNKLKMVEEELDETSHWLEVIMETGMLPENRVKPLIRSRSRLPDESRQSFRANPYSRSFLRKACLPTEMTR